MAETLKDAGPIIDIKFSDALKALFETDDSSYVALREKVFKYIITFRLVYLSDLKQSSLNRLFENIENNFFNAYFYVDLYLAIKKLTSKDEYDKIKDFIENEYPKYEITTRMPDFHEWLSISQQVNQLIEQEKALSFSKQNKYTSILRKELNPFWPTIFDFNISIPKSIDNERKKILESLKYSSAVSKFNLYEERGSTDLSPIINALTTGLPILLPLLPKNTFKDLQNILSVAAILAIENPDNYDLFLQIIKRNEIEVTDLFNEKFNYFKSLNTTKANLKIIRHNYMCDLPYAASTVYKLPSLKYGNNEDAENCYLDLLLDDSKFCSGSDIDKQKWIIKNNKSIIASIEKLFAQLCDLRCMDHTQENFNLFVYRLTGQTPIGQTIEVKEIVWGPHNIEASKYNPYAEILFCLINRVLMHFKRNKRFGFEKMKKIFVPSAPDYTYPQILNNRSYSHLNNEQQRIINLFYAKVISIHKDFEILKKK